MQQDSKNYHQLQEWFRPITNSDLNRPCFAWHPYGKSGLFKTELVIVLSAWQSVAVSHGYDTCFGKGLVRVIWTCPVPKIKLVLGKNDLRQADNSGFPRVNHPCHFCHAQILRARSPSAKKLKLFATHVWTLMKRSFMNILFNFQVILILLCP